MNDVTLAVENINWIKAGNVNADDSVDVDTDVDVNTEVDVNADAVGLLCLSDLNDMTLAVVAARSRLCRRVDVNVDASWCRCRHANFDVN